MKLTQTHVDALNTKFPPGYLIEPVELQVKRRRNEVEILQLNTVQPQVPRPARPEMRAPAPAPVPTPVPDLPRPLLDFIAKLKAHPQASLFEGYTEFTLVEERVRNSEFEGLRQLAVEVRKVWQAALATYAKGSEQYMAAIDLSSYTEALLKHLEAHRPKANVQVALQLPAPQPMTFEEKKALGVKIRSLDPKYLRGIYDIVKGSLRGSGQEMEFDLDSLPPSVCRGLAEYVDLCARKTQSLQTQPS